MESNLEVLSSRRFILKLDDKSTETLTFAQVIDYVSTAARKTDERVEFELILVEKTED